MLISKGGSILFPLKSLKRGPFNFLTSLKFVEKTSIESFHPAVDPPVVINSLKRHSIGQILGIHLL